MSTTRSSIQAGQFTAGDTITETVAALVAGVTSTTDCDAARPILERRHESAVEALEAHGEPDALAEDDEIAAHVAERERRHREVERSRAGLERLASRRTELAAEEARGTARTLIKAATPAANRAEELAARLIPAKAAELQALFAELREAETAIGDAASAASAAGISDEAAGLVLPHVRRFQCEIVEERSVIVPPTRVGVFDASGNEIGSGGGRHFGRGEAQTEPQPTRRMERVVLQRRHAPEPMTGIRVTIPTVDGGTFVVNEAG